MNWKIFFSTFALIFLAELGDKTQLAAMARAAVSDSAKWTIFSGAAAALVFSTLIAVLLGSTLTRVVPEQYIKGTAGILFIVFGVLILREALVPQRPEVRAAPSGLTSFVFGLAAEFERTAFEDYRQLAESTSHPELKRLLQELAAEEKEHCRHIEAVQAEHPDIEFEAAAADELPVEGGLMHDVAEGDRPILAHAIEHEKATSGFYRELARLTPIPAVSRAFSALASAEEAHVKRLEAFGADADRLST